MIILKVLLFAALINWCVSMQILNQTSEDRRTKIIAVLMSVATAATGALVLLI